MPNDRYWRKADIGVTGAEWPLWRKADISKSHKRNRPTRCWQKRHLAGLFSVVKNVKSVRVSYTPAGRTAGVCSCQPLPVTIVVTFPVAMMVVMTVPGIGTHTDADRADMDTDHRSIGRAGHQTKRNNRRK